MIRIAEPLPSDDGLYEYHGRSDSMLEFTGEFHADELHFEQARWYDPTVGRWLTEEVVGFAADPKLGQ